MRDVTPLVSFIGKSTQPKRRENEVSTETTSRKKTFPKIRTAEQVATDVLWAALTDKHHDAPEFHSGAVVRFVVRDKFAAGRPWRAYVSILTGTYWTIGGTGHLHNLPMQTTENLVAILRQQDFGDGDATHNLSVLSLGDKEWQL